MTQAAQAVPPDSLREVLRSVFEDPKYVWDRPRDPWAWLRGFFADLQRWLAALQDEHVVLYWLLVTVLLTVLAAIISHASVLVYRALRSRPMAVRRAGEAAVVNRSATWYQREARRLEAEGRLLESLACRFAALLHRLEDRRALRVHPSKTPMEYVREAVLDGDGRTAFAGVVREYYRYLFGGVPLDRAALAAFDERVAALTAAPEDRVATA